MVSTISSVIEKAEVITGIPLESVCVGIAGGHIISNVSRNTVAISRSNNEITEDDVERVILSIESHAIPPNYEKIHAIPIIFGIDTQKGIKDPVGMSGMRLEAEILVISGLSTRINNFIKAVHRTQLEINSLVFSPLATAEAVLNKKQKELGVLILDIGHTLTKGAIFEEGEVIHVFNIPIGSGHITADLAIGLRSSLEVAEEVKKKEGTLDIASIRRSEQVDLNKYEKTEQNISSKRNSFSRRYVNEIIEARVEEIFNYVTQELRKAKRFGKLPAGVVLTGGGAKLAGLVEYTKEKLSLPASLGYPYGLVSSDKDINNLSYAPVSGLLQWLFLDTNKPSSFWPRKIIPLGKIKGALQGIFKKITP